MKITIRKAEARDVPQMLALVRELAAFEKEPDAVSVTGAEMLEAGFGHDPVWVGWVACLSGDPLIRSPEEEIDPHSSDLLIDPSADHILGMALCYERYSTWKGRRLYLEDIIVTEKARGHRIGEKLFVQCARYAVRKNYNGMLWQVLDWNTDAIRFYDRFGAKYADEWLNGSLEREQLLNLATQ